MLGEQGGGQCSYGCGVQKGDLRAKASSEPAGPGAQGPAALSRGEEIEQSGCWGELSFAMLRALRRHRFLWTASMEGSGEPVMRWAIFTTLCSAFRFEVEQLPYHTVTQLVSMLLMVLR